MKRSKTFAVVAAAAAITILAACSDSTDPSPLLDSGVQLVFAGGGSFTAAGDPAFDDTSVIPATFAVALADSTGGIVIAAYNQRETEGDLFILQLTENRLGAFGSCQRDTANCHGRIIENITATTTTGWRMWEITSGGVDVATRDDRLTGTVTQMVLQWTDPDLGLQTRTIESGSFNLPFLTGNDALRMMRCFLQDAQGESCA